MLAHSPPLVYIHEPFNPGYGDRFTPARFPRQFQLVTSQDEERYRGDLQQTLNFYYDLSTAVRRCGRPSLSRGYWRGLSEALLTGLRFGLHRRLPGWRPLVKDPIALISSEWLAHTFPMQVVLLLRSPQGVVSSLLRFASMITPPRMFLEQPALLERLPAELVADLERAREPIDCAIVQWNICNQLAVDYLLRNPDWIDIDYERLSLDPEPGFRQLCQRLEVPFTERMRKRIERHSSAHNASEPSQPWELKRDSRRSVHQWRQRLLPDQVAYIEERCGRVWERVRSRRLPS